MLCGCPVQAVGSPPMQKERKALSLSGGILGYTPLKKKGKDLKSNLSHK